MVGSGIANGSFLTAPPINSGCIEEYNTPLIIALTNEFGFLYAFHGFAGVSRAAAGSALMKFRSAAGHLPQAISGLVQLHA